MKSLGRLLESFEGGVKKVFVVAFHALYWGVDDFDVGAVKVEDTIANALDGLLAGCGIADDAAFADVLTAGFELGLDEDDGFTLPVVLRSAEGAEDGGENKSGGDEGDVHGEEDGRWCFWGEEFAGSEEAGVGALAESEVRFVPELMSDLAVAGL
jgi:hypothetical protein